MIKAILEINKNQYLVKVNDTVIVDGNDVSNVNVLLCWEEENGRVANLKIGTPIVAGLKPELVINRSFKSKKVMVKRFKAKSRYRKTKGHRQLVSEVVVKSLGGSTVEKVVEKKVENNTELKVKNEKLKVITK